MIRSMTAFVREEAQLPEVELSCEIRSVNHRYLEMSFKLPDLLRITEPALRELCKKKMARGKVEVGVRYSLVGSLVGGEINQQTLMQLLSQLNQIASMEGSLEKPSVLDVLKYPGVFQEASIDLEKLNAEVVALVDKSLNTLLEAREREGASLADMITGRLDKIDAIVVELRELMPAIREAQGARLKNKLSELENEVDQQRLEQELVYLLQKSDVDEELDRLDTHVKEVRRIVEQGGPCGRKLDFMMQELNREANTLASKSIVTETSQSAVELKVLIEQMREQVQNLE